MKIICRLFLTGCCLAAGGALCAQPAGTDSLAREKELEGVVVSGTLKPVLRSESPVLVDVLTPQFFRKNPVPSLFEAMQLVNGVRPQVNCNVCQTGDIHINGLEGPYTMVTIDGMPLVSSLGSVYGLFGIPPQLIERVEVVKGPASGLYGSEAIGGLINVITRNPEKAPRFSLNLSGSTWQEYQADLGARVSLGRKADWLGGLHYFHYLRPADHNADGFTDMPLQRRISLFNKIRWKRRQQREASLAFRYFTEDRWGGDTRWTPAFRGGDSLYGESIHTRRWELLGRYRLPLPGQWLFSFSATGHRQDAAYGFLPYLGEQRVLFGQLTWDRTLAEKHSLLAGLAGRYQYYDDNSTATRDTLTGLNRPEKVFMPGLFLQEEFNPHPRQQWLLGLRWDHHPVHRNVWTPRLAWKWTPREIWTLRVNGGTGFRVVSLFTEEHAALTGAREVQLEESLRPERSYNVQATLSRSFRGPQSNWLLDASIWYTRFQNQIQPDYDTHPNRILYRNLNGFAHSRGISLQAEWNRDGRWRGHFGFTLQDVSRRERNENGHLTRIRPLLTESWSGTWLLSYSIPAWRFTVDYTGNVYGPMRLPLLSARDPRPPFSPVWSLQNLQCSQLLKGGWEWFFSVKNLLHWTPARGLPFLIARAHDPFDKQVQWDAAGQPVPTAENPYGLSFDPAYVYAPNQGRRILAGIRLTLR